MVCVPAPPPPLLQAAEAVVRSELVAPVVQRAVEALRDHKTFVLERALDEVLGRTPKHDAHAPAARVEKSQGEVLTELFGELEKRFEPEGLKDPVSFYFTLGDGPECKWTVKVGPGTCNIFNGKPEGGKADCVFKADLPMFTRIVREHYIPQVSEFLDGTVKSNDPELLSHFVVAFNL